MTTEATIKKIKTLIAQGKLNGSGNY